MSTYRSSAKWFGELAAGTRCIGEMAVDSCQRDDLFRNAGAPAVGAPLVTAGGLVFIGYSLDHRFRAFDLATGKVLWSAELPAPANSVPVSYEVNGTQYIVVPAGGHSMFGTKLSDTVVAYRLPPGKG